MDYATVVSSNDQEALATWAVSPEKIIAEAVARNPATSAATLEKLALHDHDDIRCAVALHNHTPEAVYGGFVNDRSWVVRYNLAHRKPLSVAIQTSLARDPAKNVRHALAMKYEVDQSVLDILKNDPDMEVAAAAAEARKLPEEPPAPFPAP